MELICLVPSEAVGDNGILSVFGEFVEIFVRSDYCISKGICEPFNPSSPRPTTDFFDYQSGTHRCTALSKFLGSHHPSVDPTLGRQCLLAKKGFRFPVPDMITYQPPLRTEFYEIKPNSAAGHRDGQDKINWFDIIRRDYGLPYVAGTQYSPNGKELIWDGNWMGVPTKVYLRWRRDLPGLIVYEVCIELSSLAEWLAKSLLKGVVVAALLLLILNPVAAAGATAAAAAARLLYLQVGSNMLSAAVGDNQPNLGNDVWYIQIFLNDWRGRHGLPLIQVSDTLTFTDETQKAIHEFQEAVTGRVTGFIEPGGPEILALEEEHIVYLLAEGFRGRETFMSTGSLITPYIGYDFHGWPEVFDSEVPVDAVAPEEGPDPALDLRNLALIGLRDYFDFLYF